MNQLEKQPTNQKSSLLFTVSFFTAIVMSIPFYLMAFLVGKPIPTILLTGLVITIMVGFQKRKRWTPYFYLFSIIFNFIILNQAFPRELSLCIKSGSPLCAPTLFVFAAYFFWITGFIGLVYTLFTTKKNKESI